MRRSSTLHHVPKGARNAWASLFFETFSDINKEFSNPDHWRRLLMLPRCILANPANGDRLHCRELLKCIRSRINRWQSGDISGLWSDFLVSEGNTNRRRHVPKTPYNLDSLRAANARRSRRAVEAGQYRKAIQALASEGLSFPTLDILDEMLMKHPQSPPPTTPSPAPPSLKIYEESIIRALRSFPGDSAPGPSLLRANHFKKAVFCLSRHGQHDP